MAISPAYNEIGTRQWFERKRAQLDERTPLDWLKGRWEPAPPARGGSGSCASAGRLTRHMIFIGTPTRASCFFRRARQRAGMVQAKDPFSTWRIHLMDVYVKDVHVADELRNRLCYAYIRRRERNRVSIVKFGIVRCQPKRLDTKEKLLLS